MQNMTTATDVATALRALLNDHGDVFAEALTDAVETTLSEEVADGDADAAERLAALEADNDGLWAQRVDTYAEVGMLTTDAGLVLTLSDGTEYQLTLVQCR